MYNTGRIKRINDLGIYLFYQKTEMGNIHSEKVHNTQNEYSTALVHKTRTTFIFIV